MCGNATNMNEGPSGCNDAKCGADSTGRVPPPRSHAFNHEARPVVRWQRSSVSVMSNWDPQGSSSSDDTPRIVCLAQRSDIISHTPGQPPTLTGRPRLPRTSARTDAS